MITVIIVTYNSKNTILDVLEALSKQTVKSFKLIIVDNHSEDDTMELIKAYLKNSELSKKSIIIELNENTGFANGNIKGFLQQHESEYIALLNPDAIPDRYWLENLLLSIKKYSNVGICASKLIHDVTKKIDSAGDGYSKILKGFKRGEGASFDLFNTEEFVFGACAGAALYRKKMLDEIGFFDKDFFLIYEDTDLNFRAQLAGWKALFVPTAIVHHKVRTTIGIMSDTAIYYSLRNSEFVRIKNVPISIFFRCLPEIILSEILEFIYFAIIHLRIKIYFKAKLDAFIFFPKMWKKRKEILRKKKVSDAYIMNLLTPVWQKDYMIAKLKKFIGIV